MSQPKKEKPKFVWDYFRGGDGSFKNPFGFVTGRNSPEALRRKLEAEKLKRELELNRKREAARVAV